MENVHTNSYKGGGECLQYNLFNLTAEVKNEKAALNWQREPKVFHPYVHWLLSICTGKITKSVKFQKHGKFSVKSIR